MAETYDQPINDQIRKYDEFRRTATGKGDDCTTGCSLDYRYFNNHYQLKNTSYST